MSGDDGGRSTVTTGRGGEASLGSIVGGMSLLQKALVLVSVLAMAGGIVLGVLVGDAGAADAADERRVASEAADGGSGGATGGGAIGSPLVSPLTGGDDGPALPWPPPLPGDDDADEDDGGGGSPPGDDGGESADPGGDGPGAPSAGDGLDQALSPALFRMGFAFFVGFSIAFAMRAFVKVTLLSAGFFFLLLFGLEYGGFVTVNWTAIADRYEGVRDWLGTELGSLSAFIQGTIPSVGAGVGGLLVGFRRV